MAVVLALVSAHALAQEPPAPPPPSAPSSEAKFSVARDDEKMMNVFTGHYGEVLHLFSDWIAEAVMRGPMEIVYMRERSHSPLEKMRKSVVRNDKGSVVTFHAPKFQIRPEEFKPENFARLRLMQLLVIPKDAPGGFQTLDKLRDAKAKELIAAGTPHELLKPVIDDWPRDSFTVSFSTPYPLFQLYTQTDKNLLIFTSGAKPYAANPADPVFTKATEKTIISLSMNLDDYRRQLIAEKRFVNDLRFALIPGAAICAFGALLSFLPGRNNWLRRVRLIGRCTFGLTAVWHILTFPILFAAWRLGLQRSVNDATIFACVGLVMPFVVHILSNRLGGRRTWRVFAWSVVANIPLVFLGYDDQASFSAGMKIISGSQNFLSLSFNLGLVGILNGISFGLTHKERAEEAL